MQVTVHEDVVIARGSEPVVRLVAIPRKPFAFGLLEGHVTGPGPDVFEPMDPEDLDGWEGGR